MKSEIHKLLYRLAEIMLQQEQHVLPVDILFDDAQIGEFVKSIQIDSPYQQLLFEGVLTESIRVEKLYVSFTVEGYFHYVLGEVIHSQSDGKDINYFLSLFQNKLKGVAEGVENCLIRDVHLGISSRLIDLIDAGGSALDVCVTPLATYFLYTPIIRNGQAEDAQKSHVSQVIDQLFYNPSDNDIEALEKTLEKLEDAQKNELSSLIYRKVIEKIEPDNLKKAFLYVQSIKHIEEDFRKSKLEKLTKLNLIEETESSGLFFNELAQQFYNCAEFENAIKYFDKSLNIYLKIYNKHHPLTGLAFNNLGLVWSEKGDYEKAMEYYEKSLEIDLNVHGKHHSSTGKTLNNLGLLWKEKGDYEKAMEYYEKSLEIDLKVNGNYHPSTGVSLNNLGVLWSDIGDNDKAIAYCEKSLEIRLKVHGHEHLSTGESLNNLGIVFSDMGNIIKAIEFNEKALEIFLKFLGDKHPNIATSYNNLGLLWNDLENYSKAISYLEKSISINLEINGNNHPSTGISLNNMGNVYRDKKEIKKAKEYYEKAYTIFFNTLGETHPHTKLVDNKLNELNDL